MPLTGKEKTHAKKRVMAKLTPWLESAGFELIAGGQTGGRFDLVANDGARLVLSIGVPTFDTFFRLWCHWEKVSGDCVAGGPLSDPYACPNTPGRRRYTFRFNADADSHERCVANIEDWVRDELVPWFESRPTVDWSNPYVIRG